MLASEFLNPVDQNCLNVTSREIHQSIQPALNATYDYERLAVVDELDQFVEDQDQKILQPFNNGLRERIDKGFLDPDFFAEWLVNYILGVMHGGNFELKKFALFHVVWVCDLEFRQATGLLIENLNYHILSDWWSSLPVAGDWKSMIIYRMETWRRLTSLKLSMRQTELVTHRVMRVMTKRKLSMRQTETVTPDALIPSEIGLNSETKVLPPPTKKIRMFRI
jgi:hypothetical protein